MARLTELSPKFAEIESKYAPSVRLVLVTRDRVTMYVQNEKWIFVEREGICTSSRPPRCIPEPLWQYVFFRVQEAMEAVREGHRQANEFRRENKMREKEKLEKIQHPLSF